MASLGQELKRERELRAISLQDMADQTKVNIRFFRALEEDRHDLLPGGFFIKATLRAYSKCIGVDENYFLNKYHEEVLLRQEEPEDGRNKGPDRPREPKPSRSSDKILRTEAKPRIKNARRSGPWILALAVVIILSALAAGYVFLLRPQRDNRPLLTTPAEAMPAEPKPAPVELPAVVPAAPVDRDMQLEISFSTETWIQVKADGAVRIDGLYKAGAAAACSAKREFLIQTGNAGGFAIRVDGRPGKPLGGPGAVLKGVRIGRDNLAEFLR